MQKTKLVILSAFYEPFMSGAEQMVKEIVERLGGHYDMTLVAARLDRKLAKFEQRPNFKLVRVGIGHKKMDKFSYPLLAAIATRKLRPQIVHAIMESYAGGALVILKYLYPKAKRILTLQSGDLDSSVKQKKFLVKAFWKIIHRSPDKLTAISTFLAKRAENLGVSAEKISITPNGVDFSEVPPQLEKISNRVICVGRLSWEKAHCQTLKAWPDVLKSFPDATLVFVGEGPERTKIENLIKELNIGGSVKLTGNLPHKQTLEEIKKSEVFICPSLAEGLGIVFIEAQACGLAVIGTAVGGIPDVIQNNENGLLIEPNSSTAISEAIKKLLADKTLAARLAARALETVKKFSWERIIVEIENIYQKVSL